MELLCGGVRVVLADGPSGRERKTLLDRACGLLPFDNAGCVLQKSPLGAPRLVGAHRTPALSFTRAGDRQWAAAAWAGGLGVDAACAGEFEPPYPVDRVFGPDERDLADCAGLSAQSTLALLWAFKEAAAKALGTGFNTVEPIELRVGGLGFRDREARAVVVAPGCELDAVAVPMGDCWLAVAVSREQEEDLDA